MTSYLTASWKVAILLVRSVYLKPGSTDVQNLLIVEANPRYEFGPLELLARAKSSIKWCDHKEQNKTACRRTGT